MLVRTKTDFGEIKAGSILVAEPIEMNCAILQTSEGNKYASSEQFDILLFDRFNVDEQFNLTSESQVGI